MRVCASILTIAAASLFACASVSADDVVAAPERYASDAATAEAGTPDFQRHVVPMLGKLGCNGRACHGSFQGRGGFRLSLFGYDFKSDHEQLVERLDTESAVASYILEKPTLTIPHEGGRRLTVDSWEYRLLHKWIADGAAPVKDDAATLSELIVEPKEILFQEDGQQRQLQATAVWSDGTREDVTALCRYQSNDEQIVTLSQNGLVSAGTPGDSHVVVFYDNAVVPVPVIRPVSELIEDKYPDTPAPTAIDQLVVAKLKKLGIEQSGLCTDAEFLRRASLDVTGTLPTAIEVEEFLADTRSDKRSRKIDELLERPGYTAWWTTRICDYTGNSDDQLNNVTPVRTQASKDWYDWVYRRVAENASYDQIAEGFVLAKSREDGEAFAEYCEKMSAIYHKGSDATYADRATMPHYWSRRNFQQPEERVIGFSYSFLGIRIQCAQCHKHPFDQWTQDDFNQFQGFFTSIQGRNNAPSPEARKEYQAMVDSLEGTEGQKGNQLRRVFSDLLKDGKTVPFGEVYPTAPRGARPPRGKDRDRKSEPAAVTARLLGGETINLMDYKDDAREPLMAWLRSPENRLFARAFVNRVWSNYFNVGIVEPPDDMNLANPASNAALLDYLSAEFIANNFDMKWLHREILNSRTYQLSWTPNRTNRLDERNFSRAVPRRIPAEVAYDAIAQATGSSQTGLTYQDSIDGRAIAIPGSGQRARAGGEAAYALTIFGRSIRESNCDCDRSAEPSLLQTVFLRNDAQMLGMLDEKDGWLAEVAAECGLKFTSRAPSASDRAAMNRDAQARRTYQQRIREREAQLQKLKSDNGNETQIAKLETQITAMRDSFAKRYPEPGDEAGASAATDDAADVSFDQKHYVNQAYLRTLSRLPTDDERIVAEQFIADAEEPIDGLRSVLWVLLNTKEFIVNH